MPRSRAGTTGSGTYPVRMMREATPDATTAWSTASAPHPTPPARTTTASRWWPAIRAKARTSVGMSLRGSSVPTNTKKGRPSANRGSTAARTARSAPGSGSSGPKRPVSTPWGATNTSVSTRHQRASCAAVTRLGQTTAAALRAATAMARRKTRTFERSCHRASSKKLMSWMVTTEGTDARSGIV